MRHGGMHPTGNADHVGVHPGLDRWKKHPPQAWTAHHLPIGSMGISMGITGP